MRYLTRQNLFGKKITLLLIFILVLSLTIPTLAAPVLPSQVKAFHKQVTTAITGEIAYDHVYALAEGIGPRRAGTEAEEEAALYIEDAFAHMGYEVKIQAFTETNSGGVTYDSHNVIAYKSGKGDKTVILGAHLDSKTESGWGDKESTGAGDNASGVGVMLEVAQFLKDFKTNANIIFVAFGAEEVGLLGSHHYVKEMSQPEKDNTIAMINLDMVGIGEHFNVYAGEEDKTFVRDLAMDIGRNMGHDVKTTPSTGIWNGLVGGWSDHAAFQAVGIPIAYFEWWYWEIDPDWGHEMADKSIYYHTPEDTIDRIDIHKLEATGEVVAAVLYELTHTPLPKDLKGKAAKAKKYSKKVDVPRFSRMIK